MVGWFDPLTVGPPLSVRDIGGGWVEGLGAGFNGSLLNNRVPTVQRVRLSSDNRNIL